VLNEETREPQSLRHGTEHQDGLQDQHLSRLDEEKRQTLRTKVSLAEHTELPCLVEWQLLLDAVLSDDDNSLLPAKNFPLFAALKALFRDSSANSPFAIL
jgi:hypothetical protein